MRRRPRGPGGAEEAAGGAEQRRGRGRGAAQQAPRHHPHRHRPAAAAVRPGRPAAPAKIQVGPEPAGMIMRGMHRKSYGRICPIEAQEGKNAGLSARGCMTWHCCVPGGQVRVGRPAPARAGCRRPGGDRGDVCGARVCAARAPPGRRVGRALPGAPRARRTLTLGHSGRLLAIGPWRHFVPIGVWVIFLCRMWHACGTHGCHSGNALR